MSCPRYHVGADGFGDCAVWDREHDSRVVSGVSWSTAAGIAARWNEADEREQFEERGEYLDVRSACG